MSGAEPGRVEAFQAWLESEGLEGAAISNPTSIAYLTGFSADPHERLMVLLIGGGRATLLLPAMEEEHAAKDAAGVVVRSWRDGEDPASSVMEALGPVARLGLEREHISLARAEWLRDLVGAERMSDVGAEVARRRARKTAREVDLLANAAAITDRVTERAMSALREGPSELEVAALIAGLVAEAGGTLAFSSLVQSGPNSAQPHLSPTGRRLERGDLVLLDFGAAHAGYRADTTRMAVLGPATREQEAIHALVLEAHDAAIAAIRPGVSCGEVDEAARAVIRRAGHGEEFIHRTGHGLGLDAHEDPSLAPGSEILLEEGMVVTVEPGVYRPGWGGVRIEDDVVVEAGGGRVLTAAARELRVVG